MDVDELVDEELVDVEECVAVVEDAHANAQIFSQSLYDFPTMTQSKMHGLHVVVVCVFEEVVIEVVENVNDVFVWLEDVLLVTEDVDVLLLVDVVLVLVDAVLEDELLVVEVLDVILLVDV